MMLVGENGISGIYCQQLWLAVKNRIYACGMVFWLAIHNVLPIEIVQSQGWSTEWRQLDILGVLGVQYKRTLSKNKISVAYHDGKWQQIFNIFFFFFFLNFEF